MLMFIQNSNIGQVTYILMIYVSQGKQIPGLFDLHGQQIMLPRESRHDPNDLPRVCRVGSVLPGTQIPRNISTRQIDRDLSDVRKGSYISGLSCIPGNSLFHPLFTL